MNFDITLIYYHSHCESQREQFSFNQFSLPELPNSRVTYTRKRSSSGVAFFNEFMRLKSFTARKYLKKKEQLKRLKSVTERKFVR